MEERREELYNLLLKTPPRIHLVSKPSKDLGDEEFLELQDHCASNTKYRWMTGLGVIDAVDAVMQASREDGKIDEKGVIHMRRTEK